MEQKHKILAAGYSLLLIPIWGISFLNQGTVTKYSVFLALIFTFYSARFMTGFGDKKELHLILLFLGPVFYVCVGVFAKGLFLFLLYPIFWAFCLFAAGVLLKNRSKLELPILFALAGFYTLYVYPALRSFEG